MIFRQFFKRQPFELEDAAYVDGCGPVRTFWYVMLPLARPAILVVFLFSAVWHWNDYYLPGVYLMGEAKRTVPMAFAVLRGTLIPLVGGTGYYVPENLIMAACLWLVLPPFLLYLFTRRYFIESIERTGMVD